MADLKRYAYDARTKAFAGVTEAQPDPLDPSNVLEPAFTTTKAPEAAPAGQAALWDGMGWTLTQDHRGEVWYKDNAPVLIDFLGDPAVQGFAPSQPDLPPNPPPVACTKLGLKRAFGDRGLWTTVRAMIASDPDMQEEWDLAISVEKSDPLIQKALAALAQFGIAMSDADVDALIADAVKAVAAQPVAA